MSGELSYIDDEANALASTVHRIDEGIAERLGYEALHARCQAFLDGLRETEGTDDATG